MPTTLLEEPQTTTREAAVTAPAGAADAGRDDWERFLQARAAEAGCRPLARWRDEEGL